MSIQSEFGQAWNNIDRAAMTPVLLSFMWGFIIKKEDWEDTDHESMIDSRNKILHLEPGIRYAGLSMEIASENGTT